MSVQATVFLTDDDPAVRDAVGLLLRTNGLAVETFSNALEFLHSDALQRPGCLLLDVRMPSMSGLDLQKRLHELHCPLPIIFMTGHGDVPMAIRAMKAGAFDFVEKPFDAQTLLQRLREALEFDAQQRHRQARYAEVEARMALLSPREREVMEQAAAGHYNKVIAANLGINISTVEIHRKRVMEKLQATSLSGMIQMIALLDESRQRPH